MFTSDDLLGGDMPDVRVGIGSGTDSGHVETSVRSLDTDNVTVYRDPVKLVDDLISGGIDAAVRGDMSSSVLLPILKAGLGVKNLERVVLMESRIGKMFFMAPVGIDEGWTVDQKHDIVVRSMRLMEKLGFGTRIAVMSGGRFEDRGRNTAVDRSIDDALGLVKMLKDEGYDAYHSQILIESAIEDADLIVAPDGITGNLIFRTLHFVGDVKAFGAPVVNIDRVFIDTSREKVDYTDSIALAMRLAGGV